MSDNKLRGRNTMESAEHPRINGSTEAGVAGTAYPWLRSYPPGVDWFQKFEPVPLPTLLDNAVARYGTRPAILFFASRNSA
jgi:hypothetical protein